MKLTKQTHAKHLPDYLKSGEPQGYNLTIFFVTFAASLAVADQIETFIITACGLFNRLFNRLFDKEV